MALFESSLVLHVVANSLDWRKVTEISVLCKCSSEGAFGPVEELWVWQLVLSSCRANQCGGGPGLHQLLAEYVDLWLWPSEVVLVIFFVNLVVRQDEIVVHLRLGFSPKSCRVLPSAGPMRL